MSSFNPFHHLTLDRITKARSSFWERIKDTFQVYCASNENSKKWSRIFSNAFISDNWGLVDYLFPAQKLFQRLSLAFSGLSKFPFINSNKFLSLPTNFLGELFVFLQVLLAIPKMIISVALTFFTIPIVALVHWGMKIFGKSPGFYYNRPPSLPLRKPDVKYTYLDDLDGETTGDTNDLENLAKAFLNYGTRNIKLNNTTLILSENQRKAFSEALKKGNIHTLTLLSNIFLDGLSDDGFSEKITEFFGVLQDTSVHTLALEGGVLSLLSVENMNALVTGLKETPVDKLDLSNCICGLAAHHPGPFFNHYTSEDINRIVELVSCLREQEIRSLNLSCNELGTLDSDGVTRLMTGLQGTEIRSLNLSHNRLDKLGRDGVTRLMTGLQGTKVRSLNLSGNDLHELCLDGISTLLPGTTSFLTGLQGTKVRSLNLSNNGLHELSSDGITTFLMGLQETEINELGVDLIDLYRLGPDGITAFLTGLRKTQVRSLSLSGDNFNALGPDRITALREGLQGTKIHTLNLDFQLSEEHVCIFRPILAQNRLRYSGAKYTLRELCQFSFFARGNSFLAIPDIKNKVPKELRKESDKIARSGFLLCE